VLKRLLLANCRPYQFTKLVSGVGGFGQAMGLLKDVAAEVWERISDGAWVIVLRMRSVSNNLKASWFDALAAMQDKWAGFLKAISGAAFKIPGMTGLANSLAFDAGMAGQAVDGLRERAADLALFCGLSVPLISRARSLPPDRRMRKSGTYRRREPAHM